MRKFLLTLWVLAGAVGYTAASQPVVPLTYVSVSTFTPGRTKPITLAFQNTSSVYDVRIVRIELTNFTTMTVNGAITSYYVYGSTVMTHGGTSQSANFNLQTANSDPLSFIQVSTNPINIILENAASGLYSTLIKILYVNDDETATTNLTDMHTRINDDFTPASDIILPKGANRGLIFWKIPFNGLDVQEGQLMARITYTVR